MHQKPLFSFFWNTFFLKTGIAILAQSWCVCMRPCYVKMCTNKHLTTQIILQQGLSFFSFSFFLLISSFFFFRKITGKLFRCSGCGQSGHPRRRSGTKGVILAYFLTLSKRGRRNGYSWVALISYPFIFRRIQSGKNTIIMSRLKLPLTNLMCVWAYTNSANTSI